MALAIRVTFKSAAARHIFIGAALFSIAAYAISGWLPSLLIREAELSLGATGGLLALVFGLGGAFGTLLGGTLADHFGTRNPGRRLRPVAAVLLLMAPVWAAVFLTTNAGAMLSLLVLPGVLIGFYLGPTFAMVRTLVEPGTRATAATLLLLVTNVIGLGVGPLAVGALSDALAPAFGPDSLRLAMLIVPPLLAWSASHYFVASLSLRERVTSA